jgi:hypothetical protein
MNRLQNRLAGSYSDPYRQTATAIRLQTIKNLSSTSHFSTSISKARQTLSCLLVESLFAPFALSQGYE